ncbi:MAG: hemolysin III family protein, partial [Clostridia bacterium]|nr:hemolysin III family protein [Clostridia bacterium]
MTSHIVGGALGLAALALCVIFAAIYGDAYAVVSSSIYGFTIILLYTMSSIYHGLKPERPSKKVFQVLDHCSIFLLIAGSYTPFCLVTLREQDGATGWWIFGIIWAMALIGIALNSIDIKKFKLVSMICYLVMGWCIVLKIN